MTHKKGCSSESNYWVGGRRGLSYIIVLHNFTKEREKKYNRQKKGGGKAKKKVFVNFWEAFFKLGLGRYKL